MNAIRKARPPKLGDVRYLATWIDDAHFRRAATLGGYTEDGPDSRLEFAELADSEMAKEFASMESAKSWAVAHAAMDYYGTPRVETQTLSDDGYGEPYEWARSDMQEFCEDLWIPL